MGCRALALRAWPHSRGVRGHDIQYHFPHRVPPHAQTAPLSRDVTVPISGRSIHELQPAFETVHGLLAARLPGEWAAFLTNGHSLVCAPLPALRQCVYASLASLPPQQRPLSPPCMVSGGMAL